MQIRDWRNDALCIRQDWGLYFPTKTKGSKRYSVRQYYEAQELCLHCPVQVECLTYAVQNRLTQGTFGLPANERKGIKKETKIDLHISKVIARRDSMDIEFAKNGNLEKKRCLQCHRKSNLFYFDSGGWGGLRANCVSCSIQIEQNKKSYPRRYSESKPRFTNWGQLTSKVCTRCKRRRKAKEFAYRIAGIGGRTSWCRQCVAKHTADYDRKKRAEQRLVNE